MEKRNKVKKQFNKIDWSKMKRSKSRKSDKKNDHKSVRWPVTLGLTIAMLLPVLATLLFSYIQTSHILTQRIQEQERQITTNVVKTIDNAALAAESTIERLAMDATLNQVSSGIEAAKSDLSSKLQYISTGNRYISDAYYISTGDNPDYISTLTLDDTDNLSETLPWLTAATEANGLQWSQPYELKNKTRMTVSRPLVAGREVIGVLAVDLDLETIKADVRSAEIAETGSIQIFTNDGTLLASPEESIIGQNFKDTPFFQSANEVSADNANGFVYDETVNKNKFGIYFENISSLGLKVFGMVTENEMNTEISALNKMVLIITIFTIILAAFISYFATGIIISIAVTLMKSFNEIRRGNLTYRLDFKTMVAGNNPFTAITQKLSKKKAKEAMAQKEDLDPKGNEIHQIGLAFNETMSTFEETITFIQGNSFEVSEMATSLTELSDQTRQATAEVAETITGVAEATSTQTQDTETTASQMNDLSQALNEINDAVGKMGEHADTTMVLNGSNIFATQDVDTNWKTTLTTMNDLKSQIEEVDGDIQNIEGIVNAITNIAKKTNLLALNASIEAARAGEAGRGFAVVAEEIRSLAEQSAQSSKDIQQIIHMVQGKSTDMVEHLEDTNQGSEIQTQKIEEALTASENVASSLEQLVASMIVVMQSSSVINQSKDEVVSQLENIAASAEENSAGTEEVSANAEEILATMEDFSTHINKLEDVAETLKKSAERFEINSTKPVEESEIDEQGYMPELT
ncbi:methyl-accepting chemotaxis protein [Marinilactibacillus kalidii]|uniref:methyl-accepting chemotaxis protein n=1 Tax=Marinilactibacillus kalidii TaxID=2820274 RepID=UPI001ABE6617|nr:methyl-accepting chemotaxis protein [Marinilactibacillus kalidii]